MARGSFRNPAVRRGTGSRADASLLGEPSRPRSLGGQRVKRVGRPSESLTALLLIMTIPCLLHRRCPPTPAFDLGPSQGAMIMICLVQGCSDAHNTGPLEIGMA